MFQTRLVRTFSMVTFFGLLAMTSLAMAAEDKAKPSTGAQSAGQTDPYRWQPLSLAQAEPRKNSTEKTERIDSTKIERESDSLTERQSVDAFNSLEDGQPGAPGDLELEVNAGWQTSSRQHTHDPFALLTELQYTPDGSEFLRNMQLLLGVPVEMGLGGVDGNADVNLGWQQRWVKEQGSMPTLSTLAEMRLPTGYHSSGVDGKLTGIIAKDVGPGTAYLNGFVKTANGNNIEDVRHFQWGGRVGYKWRINDSLALIGDYLNQSSEENGHGNLNVLELSGQYRFNEHLTVGPGIQIGLDNHDETPNFGAGVRFQITF